MRKLSLQLAIQFPKFRKLTSQKVASLSLPKGQSSAPIATKKGPGALPNQFRIGVTLCIDRYRPARIQDQESSQAPQLLHLGYLDPLAVLPGEFALVHLHLSI